MNEVKRFHNPILSLVFITKITDDSEVRLVRTCSRWKCLRGPLPRLKRVCLDCECNSEVRLTLAMRLVHTKDQKIENGCYNQGCVQGVFRIASAVACSN